MVAVVIPEGLWNTAIMPEGVLERWHVADGALVRPGDLLASVRIEDALHEITAPGGGRVRREASERDVLLPGTIVAQVAPA